MIRRDFWTEISSLQDKTTSKNTSWVVTVTEDLQTGMLESHGNVTLEADIIYTN